MLWGQGQAGASRHFNFGFQGAWEKRVAHAAKVWKHARQFFTKGWAMKGQFVAGLLLLGGLAVQGAEAVPASAPALQLSDKFPRIKAPGTGRLAVQLTAGGEANYPLYYFIPSISRDGKYLVHHRYANKMVQLWRLNLQTAELVQLTHANGTNTDWHPWSSERGLGGVMDYRSTLNVARNLVIYFDRNQARGVDLETLKDEPLFTLPPDREAIGQNTTTPDGQWFVYIDAPAGAQNPRSCQGAKLMAFNLDKHAQKMLFMIDNAIHHALTYDATHFIVNHPPGHNGIIWTDLTGGRWSELREGDPGAQGHSCHQLPTVQGISYEVFGAGPCAISGLYDPFTRRRFEFNLPPQFAYTHTGWDRTGRLWFWETTGKAGHSLWYLEKMDRATGGVFKPLTGHWPLAASGQRGHFHPQLTPDRRWVQMTGGDEQRRAQIFLLDASDLPDTAGISQDLLSATGANDVHVPGQLIAAPETPARRVRLGGDALAEMVFDDASQAYRGTPYIFLGDETIQQKFLVAPKPDQQIALLWGAKNDQRTATLKINGTAVEVAGGGYDGFRWLVVPVPAGVTGSAYDLTLEKAAHGKAAFVAALRVTGK